MEKTEQISSLYDPIKRNFINILIVIFRKETYAQIFLKIHIIVDRK